MDEWGKLGLGMLMNVSILLGTPRRRSASLGGKGCLQALG